MRRHTLLGIAMACAGVVTAGRAHAQPAPGPPPEPERRSVGKMASGIVLTSFGAVHGAAGGIAMLAAVTSCNNEYCGVYILMASSLVLGGGIFAAIGVPLWVSGARRKEPGEEYEYAGSYVPAVAIGPRSAAMTWRF